MTLEGYLAFTPTRAWKVEASRRLAPAAFGPPFLWIPFADTMDGAIEKAMMSSVYGMPEAAMSRTHWRVLHIWLSAEQFLEAFKANRLLRTTSTRGLAEPLPGWGIYGEVELGNGNAFEWMQFTVAPIGIMRWAEKLLSKRYNLRADGRCCSCGAVAGPTWTARKHALPSPEDFCTDCWYAYCMERVSEVDMDKEVEEATVGDQ